MKEYRFEDIKRVVDEAEEESEITLPAGTYILNEKEFEEIYRIMSEKGIVLRSEPAKSSLEDLCITYIRLIHTVKDGYMRVKTHNAITIMVGEDKEEEIKEILHNLDKYIGYNPYYDYEPHELDNLGKKLARKLKEIM